jgi:lysophospholipase L1-like esterase
MQPTNGSTVSFGARTRLIGCCLAVMLALSVLAFASTARAEGPSQTYLALGDSLAFGYSQQLFNENFPTESPTAFEHGYTNDLLGNTVKEGVQLTNKGCPGETTDSLIGNGPLAAALKIPGESPCAYHKVGFPLHSEYGGTKSQLESALETIAVDAASGTPVTKLTLDIGANDIFRSERACKKEVEEEFAKEGKSKYGSTGTEAVQNCVKAHIPETYQHIVENTGRILFVLRNGSSFRGVNYTGKVIFLGLYDSSGAVFTPGVELFPGSVEAVGILNREQAKVVTSFEGCAANPLPTFNPQNKQEPERLQRYTNMANFTEFAGKKNGPDIHPTPVGYEKLADIMSTECISFFH